MIIYIILIAAVLLALLFLAMMIENTALTTTKYEICSDRLPKDADGTNFVVIADLHNNQFGHKNANLICKIDELNPDFVIVAGDLFIGREYNFDYAYDFLQQVSQKYPVFYAYGNHEQKVEEYEMLMQSSEWKVKKANRPESRKDTRVIKTFAEFCKKVNELGVQILDNESASLPINENQALRIFGGTIGLDYFKRFRRPVMSCEYLNQCFGSCEHKEYQILIAHNPMYFDLYAEWGADLVLAGHVHGGMVRVPFLGGVISPQMQIFPKYDAGLFQKRIGHRESSMIVSRGLGIHTLKIRLFNRPELVHVLLKKK